MKPNATEEYFVHGGHPLTQTCAICNEPYRGSNTMSLNVGYGRYRQFPAHVRCEKQAERERPTGG